MEFAATIHQLRSKTECSQERFAEQMQAARQTVQKGKG